MTTEQINFKGFSDRQLDEIYMMTVGYRPLSEDGFTRDEVIEILEGWEEETGEPVKFPENIETIKDTKSRITMNAKHNFSQCRVIVDPHTGKYLSYFLRGEIAWTDNVHEAYLFGMDDEEFDTALTWLDESQNDALFEVRTFYYNG